MLDFEGYFLVDQKCLNFEPLGKLLFVILLAEFKSFNHFTYSGVIHVDVKKNLVFSQESGPYQFNPLRIDALNLIIEKLCF